MKRLIAWWRELWRVPTLEEIPFPPYRAGGYREVTRWTVTGLSGTQEFIWSAPETKWYGEPLDIAELAPTERSQWERLEGVE